MQLVSATEKVGEAHASGNKEDIRSCKELPAGTGAGCPALSGIINEWNICDVRLNIESRNKKLTTDQWLYAMPSQQVFAEIYDITFPDDMDSGNKDCFDITPASSSDHNGVIFSVDEK